MKATCGFLYCPEHPPQRCFTCPGNAAEQSPVSAAAAMGAAVGGLSALVATILKLTARVEILERQVATLTRATDVPTKGEQQ